MTEKIDTDSSPIEEEKDSYRFPLVHTKSIDIRTRHDPRHYKCAAFRAQEAARAAGLPQDKVETAQATALGTLSALVHRDVRI